MTAYLQHGDAVHIVIPMPMRHGTPDIEQAQKEGRDLIHLYATYGVTVASCSASSATSVATIVAAFRKPDIQEVGS